MKKTFKEVLFLTIITLNLLIAVLDSQILTPAFPDIMKYFKTTENWVQYLLSANFFTFCLGSLICGPLSDSIGRKKVLVGGLALYIVAGVGCVLSTSIETLLFWRLIQGPGVASCMIVAGIIIFDSYDNKKGGRRIALLFSASYALLSIGVAVASWLVGIYGWKATFVTITSLALATLVLTIFTLKEPLDKEHHKRFNLVALIHDFKKLTENFEYMGPVLITSFMFSALMVYVANLSLIFINHLGVHQSVFGFYQMAVIMSLVVTTFLLSVIGEKLGLEKLKKFGVLLAIAGAMGLLIIEVYDASSPLLITIAMCITIAGTGFSFSLFIADFMNVFPRNKGTSGSFGIFIRLIITSIVVTAGSQLFDGTMRPVVTIVSVLIFACLGLYYFLEKRRVAK